LDDGLAELTLFDLHFCHQPVVGELPIGTTCTGTIHINPCAVEVKLNEILALNIDALRINP
jgi:hypothetical protein